MTPAVRTTLYGIFMTALGIFGGVLFATRDPRNYIGMVAFAVCAYLVLPQDD